MSGDGGGRPEIEFRFTAWAGLRMIRRGARKIGADFITHEPF